MNKQKLQEQIDTMREELAKMETELAEFEKVELNTNRHCFNLKINGGVPQFGWKDLDWIQAGATRATKELAEIASKNMVTRNKLEAYAMQLEPEWRDEGCGTYSYSIYSYSGKYTIAQWCGYRTLGAVYMSKSTAEQICEWLNDGRIEL